MTTDAVRHQEQAATNAPDGSRWGALTAVLLGAFMILLDSTIVNVAVPPIQESLRASYGAVEWVVGGYALAYGLLLIPAGRLGERYGYKRLFLIGLTGFTIASVLCGAATSPAMLIACRVLQGVMAGVMNPQILAVIQVAFPPQERGKAFGWYGAVSGVAVAAGPLLGGLLIQADLAGSSWRPIFLINLPIGIVACLVALSRIREARGRGGDLDLVGVVLISAAVLLLTYPLIEGRAAGWPAWAFLCLAASIPALAAFVAWEIARARRGRTPLIDMRLFRNRSFAAGAGIALSYFAGFISLFFILSLYLQIGLGRSALYAGLTMLPFAAGTFAGASASDRIAQRLGRSVLLLGASLVILGMTALILTIRAAGTGVTGLQMLPSLLIGGIGSGLVIAPNVDIVLSAVPRRDAGSAGGVLNAAQRIGQALGIAIVGVALFGSLGPSADSVTAAALAQSYTHAVQVAAYYSLGAVLLAFLLVFLLPRR